MVRAAVRTSSQVFGCQSAGRPAFAKMSLLNQRPRVSVPSGTPYVFPSSAFAAVFAVSMNWFQSGHFARYGSRGFKYPLVMSELMRKVSSYTRSGAVLGERSICWTLV